MSIHLDSVAAVRSGDAVKNEVMARKTYFK